MKPEAGQVTGLLHITDDDGGWRLGFRVADGAGGEVVGTLVTHPAGGEVRFVPTGQRVADAG